MDPLSEPTISRDIRAVQRGDKLAWDQFAAKYQPLVRLYVRRFKLQDENDADDLVQETFTKLREQMPRFQLDHGKGRFRAWLRSVTDNTVRDWLRARQRERKHGGAVDPEVMAESFADDAAHDDVRSLEWRRAVLDLVLRQVREEFAQRQKVFACFEQSTLKNRPAKEVAAELGIDTVNNVYVYAHRVMQRVRALCEEYDEELDDAPTGQ